MLANTVKSLLVDYTAASIICSCEDFSSFHGIALGGALRNMTLVGR